MQEDLVVAAHDGIPLAVRDHAGDGPPLILLHGAGAHLLAMGRLARLLAGYRVVTMDQRWSGQSGDSEPYRWDVLVDDVEAVIASLGLDNPAVAGHSWGGMIAAHYAARHPEVPGAVNLDGHGPGHPSQYEGGDPDAVEALFRLAADVPPWMGGEGDDEWKATQLAEVRDGLVAGGLPGVAAEAFAERNFLALGDGRWRRRPSPTMYQGLTGDLQLFDVYRRVEAPLAIVVTNGSDWGPPSAGPIMTAYRRVVLRTLNELADERPNVRVVEHPDTGHTDIVGRHAGPAAETITAFLTAVGDPPAR